MNTTLEAVTKTIDNKIGIENYKIRFDVDENCLIINYSDWVPVWMQAKPNWLANDLSDYGFNAVAIANDTTYVYGEVGA